jgi:hypothetical protein
MILNIAGAQLEESFLGIAQDADGNDYKVKIMSYDRAIAHTENYGDIYGCALLEAKTGEILWKMLFFGKLTKEEVEKQANHMINNVTKILEEKRNG